MKQEHLIQAGARLTSWTKGFTCSGVVNEDVVKMLQTAIDEKVREYDLSDKAHNNIVHEFLEYKCAMCRLN
jgi:hypothetical protein